MTDLKIDYEDWEESEKRLITMIKSGRGEELLKEIGYYEKWFPLCDGIGSFPLKSFAREDLEDIEESLGINLQSIEKLNRADMVSAPIDSQIYAFALTLKDRPEIIIFGHEKCTPCKQLKERLDDINRSKLFNNQLQIREFDVLNNPIPVEIQNQIKSVPALYISGKNIFHFIDDFDLTGEIIKGFSDTGPKIL